MSARPADSLLANAKLFELSPDHVDEGHRIGFLHEDKAAALGRLMAVDGQRDPIKVVANPINPDRPWKLVTGMHRLIGARIEGITVFAIEVSGKPEDLVDLEASENLHRRRLAPLEQAKFTAALVSAAKERVARAHGGLKQEQIAARARWDQVKAGAIRAEQALADETADAVDKMSSAYGWKESAADALSLGAKEVQRSLALHRLIVEPFPDLVEALANHPVVGENAKQLREIAAVRDEGQRRAVIDKLLSDPELSAEGARVEAGIEQEAAPATPVAHRKYVNAVIGNLDRLSASLQKRHLPEFVRMLKSDEVKRQLRDILNEELGND